MKYVITACLALTLFVLTGCNSREHPHAQMQQAQMQSVDRFYKMVLALDVRGIASKETIDQLSPLISNDLHMALLQALVAETQHIRETKGEEAPLFEGPLFLGVWEGAQRVSDVRWDGRTDQVSYWVTLASDSPDGKQPANSWQDRVVLVQENGRWVVDDLVFLAADVGANARTLLKSLRQGRNCQDPETQTDMNICADQTYQVEIMLMNDGYKQLLGETDAKRQQSLKTAQLAWVKFRDLQCEHEASASEGGSIQPLIRSTCLIDLTRQRSKELKALLEEEH